MNEKDNGLSHIKSDVLCQLRRVARSETNHEGEETMKALKLSDAGKNNARFSVYFTKYWLRIKNL